MARKQEIRLGKVQLRIMQFLWGRGEATAREISDHLSGSEPLAHSTVQTLLRKLEIKRAITHVERERVFFFSPLVVRSEVTASSTRDFLDRVFQGSAAGLVSHILEHEDFSPQELRELRDMIDRYEKEAK